MLFTATYGLAGPFKVLLYEFYYSCPRKARKNLGQFQLGLIAAVNCFRDAHKNVRAKYLLKTGKAEDFADAISKL